MTQTAAPRYEVQPHHTHATRFQIFDHETGKPAGQKIRGRWVDDFGNPIAARIFCAQLNTAHRNGQPVKVEPYRNPHFPF